MAKIKDKRPIILLSDIHGNLSALEAVLEDIRARDVPMPAKQEAREHVLKKIKDQFDIDEKEVFSTPERTRAFKLNLQKRLREEGKLPKIYDLGDKVGYFLETTHVAKRAEKFNGSVEGNHEQISKIAIATAKRERKKKSKKKVNPAKALERMGVSERAAKSLVVVARQIMDKPDIVSFLGGLPSSIKIGKGIWGMHAPRGKYPLTKDLAEQYDISEDECLSPEESFSDAEIFPEGIRITCVGHDHIQGVITFDGSRVESWAPTYEPGDGEFSILNGSYRVPKGTKRILLKVGSVGEPRLRTKEEDEHIADMERKIAGIGKLMPAHYTAYYPNGTEENPNETVDFRRVYYEGQETLNATAEAIKKFEEGSKK